MRVKRQVHSSLLHSLPAQKLTITLPACPLPPTPPHLSPPAALPSTSPTRGLEQLITFPRANARRQECAHAHMVKMWTRGSVPSVLVADLGSDCVWTLAYEAEAQTPLRVWPLALLELKLAQLRLMQSQGFIHFSPQSQGRIDRHQQNTCRETKSAAS